MAGKTAFQKFGKDWLEKIRLRAAKEQRIFGRQHGRVPNPNPKRAAVLIPLCNRHEVPEILFTLRTNSVGTHKGQVSFPGGHIDSNESAIDAAIRETQEELGTGVGKIDVLSTLPEIPAITGTMVTPVLGFLRNDVEDFQAFSINQNEVERVFTRSLEELLEPEFRTVEDYNRNNMMVTLPIFGADNGDERIWGFTAYILDEILHKIILGAYKS